MRYSGKFGFVVPTETAPGVIEDLVTEREYVGDVIQRTEAFMVANSVLPEYRATTSVSVLSDGILKKQYKNLRFIEYMDELWTISSIVFNWPRITIYIGELYNGPT